MAVLVRSGRASIPALRRCPRRRRRPGRGGRRRHPAGARAGRAAAARRARAWSSTPRSTTRTDADYVGADRVEALLTSPLGGLDATDVRSLTRAMRARRPGATPARELVRGAVARAGSRSTASTASRPAARAGWPGCSPTPAPRSPTAAPSRRCSGCSGTAPTGAAGCAAPPQAGGQAARLAHRDLDAICALFETAARAEEQKRPHQRALRSWPTLRAQEIPADTLADRGVRGDAVRLLTAHRSKGLEWRLVVVARVQEGAWPDLRRRGPLLQRRPDRPATGCAPPITTPRPARRGASAVLRRRAPAPGSGSSSPPSQSPDDDGEQPSPLRRTSSAAASRCTASGRPRRPLSLAGLVAELRRTARRPRPARAAPAARPLAGCGSWPTPTCTAARWRPAPTRRPGGGCASRAAPSARCARRTSR